MQGSQMIYAITLTILSYTCDPVLTRTFTPRRPRVGAYDVCVTAEPLELARSDGFTYAAPEQLDPIDAFGAGGAYDRSKLAQLYHGERVTVVRGWRAIGDRFESVTLLSPYPDASQTKLEPGTMIVRYTFDTKDAIAARR
jgi:hypothetical protein